MRTHILRMVIALAPFVGQAGALSAQETGIVGRVVDGSTGLPIPGVMVGVIDEGEHVLTESDGAFYLPDVAPGAYRVVIDRLGYEPFDAQVTFTSDVRTISLVVRPVPLAAIEVEIDRLESRRQHVPERSHVFTAEDLEARLQDPAAFLRGRGQIRPVPCDHPSGCVMSRGQKIAMSVFIDDSAVPAAMEYLSLYPPELVARIEVFPSCGMIRVYSKRHLERLARIGGRVQGIACIKSRVP